MGTTARDSIAPGWIARGWIARSGWTWCGAWRPCVPWTTACEGAEGGEIARVGWTVGVVEGWTVGVEAVIVPVAVYRLRLRPPRIIRTLMVQVPWPILVVSVVSVLLGVWVGLGAWGVWQVVLRQSVTFDTLVTSALAVASRLLSSPPRAVKPSWRHRKPAGRVVGAVGR